MTAACPGGGSPDIVVTEGAPAVCALHEYNQAAGNANVVVYRDDMWPYTAAVGDTLALTSVTFSPETGEI